MARQPARQIGIEMTRPDTQTCDTRECDADVLGRVRGRFKTNVPDVLNVAAVPPCQTTRTVAPISRLLTCSSPLLATITFSTGYDAWWREGFGKLM
jgi:hypothetical protein